ncbi:MAG: hypothetical protein KY456_07435, partial [Chloroflexi bacterium]|nr:hypothetical protein [Chloroflexota bacterium]
LIFAGATGLRSASDVVDMGGHLEVRKILGHTTRVSSDEAPGAEKAAHRIAVDGLKKHGWGGWCR